MATKGQKRGITKEDKEAYQELNQELEDPFHDEQDRGPKLIQIRVVEKPAWSCWESRSHSHEVKENKLDPGK
ncbi:MAG: hypothetical protein GY789_24770 [Hyphomicrobiales bacterium]|nr:hypothetical protein [Hyphomicrobiales bacterium]MCP4997804.1 hypothetical protein [Hyphomicrobiales bacterium]